MTRSVRVPSGETGLDYVEARYYRSAAEIPVSRDDPAIGMFRQVDPLWEKFNRFCPYSYSSSDPINNTDPSGLWTDPIKNPEYRGWYASGWKPNQSKL